MLLHRQMRIAFIKESIFANQISVREAFINVAEFKRDFLMNVAPVTIFMNARLINHQTFFDRRDRLQGLVFDFDQIHCIERDVFIDSCNRRDGIADEAHFVDAQRVFVLTDRKNAI